MGSDQVEADLMLSGQEDAKRSSEGLRREPPAAFVGVGQEINAPPVTKVPITFANFSHETQISNELCFLKSSFVLGWGGELFGGWGGGDQGLLAF